MKKRTTHRSIYGPGRSRRHGRKDNIIGKSMIVEFYMTRNYDTSRGRIIATRTLTIIGGSKINTWQGARFECV